MVDHDLLKRIPKVHRSIKLRNSFLTLAATNVIASVLVQKLSYLSRVATLHTSFATYCSEKATMAFQANVAITRERSIILQIHKAAVALYIPRCTCAPKA